MLQILHGGRGDILKLVSGHHDVIVWSLKWTEERYHFMVK
jgi:hypothetical protein